MYQSVSRSLKPLLLILSLICFAALFPQSPGISVSAHATPPPPPLRLRLKVDKNTLRPGETTKISAQFLDGSYQQVPNDGTRMVTFGLVAPAGQKPGGVSPQQVKVGNGAWSADAIFTSSQPGKVIIEARADGLDPARTTLVVTRPVGSYLSQLFDTGAYAQGFEGFAIDWQTERKPQANSSSKATFQVTFLETPPAGTKVRVRVDAPARIVYDGQDRGTFRDVIFDGTSAGSKDIDVISGRVGKVNVSAAILPNGPEKRDVVEFIAPRPSRIIIVPDSQEIMSTDNLVRLSVHLTDDSGNALEPDAERSITLKAAGSDDPVDFDPNPLVFSPNQNQPSAESWLRLSGLPSGNELRIVAVGPRNANLTGQLKTITIRSPIQGVTLVGPSEVTRGNSSAEFTVTLRDKDGKTRPADWDRKINLSATNGTFTPNPLMIPKGQATAKVNYVSADTTGKVSLKAESWGLMDGSQEIVLITAVYWLVLAAVGGGLLGGVVRHLPRGDKLAEDQPKRATMRWTGLVGSIAGSIVSGFFLYLAMKLGFSRMLGSLALPSLDYGTILVALFLGGVGGYKGPSVFDWLASVFTPRAQKGETPQPAASGVN
jgi:hypothetical protein